MTISDIPSETTIPGFSGVKICLFAYFDFLPPPSFCQKPGQLILLLPSTGLLVKIPKIFLSHPEKKGHKTTLPFLQVSSDISVEYQVRTYLILFIASDFINDLIKNISDSDNNLQLKDSLKIDLSIHNSPPGIPSSRDSPVPDSPPSPGPQYLRGPEDWLSSN